MIPIVVVPFASEIHGKEYYVGLYDIIKNHIATYGVEIHKEVITDPEEAIRVGKKYSGFLPIAIILTGGTSSLIENFSDSGNFERIIMFSHSQHNSLASAVSARSKMERKGIMSLVYHCSNINSIECMLIIRDMMNVVRSVTTVIGSRIGLVVDRDTKNEIEETFESRFNSSIHIKSFEQVLEEMNRCSESDINEVKKSIMKVIEVEGPSEYMDEIARLYLVLKNFVVNDKLDAIAIDCFPFILKKGVTPCIPLSLLNSEGIIAGCEADLPALLGLMLARLLTGRSGWIANVVDVSSNRCVLAHCTIALDIAKNVRGVTHYESGKPYGVTGEYIGETVTILSIDRDFTVASIATANVVASGALGYSACRTQMILEFGHSTEYLPNIVPNNHHIVMQGNLSKKLTEALYLMGFDVIEYREYAGYSYA